LGSKSNHFEQILGSINFSLEQLAEIWAENQNIFLSFGAGGKKKVGAVVVGADENNTNKILLRAFKKIF